MTKKIVSATAVVIGVGSLMAGCSFEQATAGCIVQDATNWAAVYELDQATVTPACADSDATKLKGEQLGIFKFADPNNPSDVKLVIRPNGLASRAVRDSGSPYLQNAMGKMVAEPDADDFCAASEFSEAKVNDIGREANPAANPPITGIAPTDISYKFDSFSVYAAPSVPGTQAKGILTYTRDNCTVKYAVNAVWPAIGCVPGSDKPAESCGAGSGSNPDFDLRCEADALGAGVHACVPAKPVPSLK